MATPKWSASTLYVPGSLVQPLTAPTPQAIPPDNPNFALGNTGWDLDSGLSIVAEQGYGSPNSLRLNTGLLGPRDAINQYQAAVNPGQSITASCSIQQGASASGNAGGLVKLMWYDSGDILLAESVGSNVNSGSGGAWNTSTVTGSAPAGAAYARVAIGLYRNSENFPVWAANVTWNYVLTGASGLIYQAVQPAPGFSAATEPVWPLVNGVQVVDNQVIWEAMLITRIVWEAQPILVSGPTEPSWPLIDGQTTPDNTISWETVSRRVEDEKCPNSRIVIIASSKIFAADGDIVPYSATVNPLDWSTPDDAGYLPTNLQQYGANPVGGLGLYRGNLHVMNSQGSQAWQVDEDPAQMALLDAFPIGTTYHESISPAFNDLFILTELGVRSTGIAGGSTNLQAGDVGMPVDPLVQQALAVAKANNVTPQGLYNPNAGQYWLMFSQYPPGPVAIHGALGDVGIGAPVQTFAYTGTGGIQPYTFQLINGTTMPPGLTLNTNGSVSGTPTTLGTYSWDVQITDSTGDTDWLTDTSETVNAPTISGDAPDATYGMAYSYQYTVTPGDAAVSHCEFVNGPPWLTIDATGLATGTAPFTGGPWSFTVRVVDVNGAQGQVADSLALTGVGALLINTTIIDITGSGGGSAGFADGFVDDNFSGIVDSTEPWARILTIGISSLAPPPAEVRSLIYSAPSLGGDLMFDSGWNGDASHQVAMTSALATAGLSAFNGPISSASIVLIGGSDPAYVHATLPFVLPTNFATWSARLVWYQSTSSQGKVIRLERPNPALIPVGVTKVVEQPGYYFGGGQLYVCNWTAVST